MPDKTGEISGEVQLLEALKEDEAAHPMAN